MTNESRPTPREDPEHVGTIFLMAKPVEGAPAGALFAVAAYTDREEARYQCIEQVSPDYPELNNPADYVWVTLDEGYRIGWDVLYGRRGGQLAALRPGLNVVPVHLFRTVKMPPLPVQESPPRLRLVFMTVGALGALWGFQIAHAQHWRTWVGITVGMASAVACGALTLACFALERQMRTKALLMRAGHDRQQQALDRAQRRLEAIKERRDPNTSDTTQEDDE